MFVKYYKQQQHRDRNNQNVRKQQIPLGHELSRKVVQRQLNGCVVRSGKEVQRIRKIVKDKHGLCNDDRGGYRLKQRQDHVFTRLSPSEPPGRVSCSTVM